ncbi:putative glutamine ABC transporter permease protein GlnM [Ensifer psoraleae]|uniref:amino acid ABC transporter permease n=1 Tax=Sinorhizobium psoraleae TaxID=520838 RepID=UPI00156A37DD|nr:amino acid ABC transporter permease [Sinorhizobium psoraleae]NRP72154.1 putative glutamine ABC transporter permease protein GlnM [Sinorhizobium psoraleae]
MNYTWDFTSILTYRHLLYQGIGGTLLLSGVSVATAMAIGLIMCLLRTAPSKAASLPAAAFVVFFRNIPFIVQLFWLFYAIPVLTGLQAKPFIAAYLALSLYGGAYFTEIFRAGLQGVEKGQWEAAKAIGLGYSSTLKQVIVPQAIRRVVPPLTTQVIELIKLTTVASSIAYAELLYAGKLVADQDFRPLEAYTTVAILLILLLSIVSMIGAWCESRLKIEAR